MFFKQIDQHQAIRHEGDLQEAGYLPDQRYLVDTIHEMPDERYLANYSEDYSVQSENYAQNEAFAQGQHQFQPESSSSFQAIVFNEHLESSI